MSYQEPKLEAVPAETAQVAHAVYGSKNRYIQWREELGLLFTELDYGGLYSSLGQPGLPAWRLVVVSILQYAEGLTDRQAADAVRGRIDWKYLLGLALDDKGFDFSALSEFRDRLIRSQGGEKLLQHLLEQVERRGLLKGYGQQRTDATHMLAVVRTLNQLELVGETLRACLNVLAVAAPEWLQQRTPTDWYARYTLRISDWQLPRNQTQRNHLALQIGHDGQALLTAIYAPDTPSWLCHIPAVQVLRKVWIQQFVSVEGQLVLRDEKNQPPAHLKINSPYETDARYGKKTECHWLGYKAHFTETCTLDQLHLITHVETTPATILDHHTTPAIHEALAQQHHLPDQHLVDAGYVDAQVLLDAHQQHGVDLIGPVQPDRSWQAKAGQGFDITHFQVNWSAQQVTCPQGQHSRQWLPAQDAYGNPVIRVRFPDKVCQSCPVRNLCTRDSSRGLTLRPQPIHEYLQFVRLREGSSQFKNVYKRRAGVEATFSQSTRVTDLRHARYRGLHKVHLQQVLSAIAINILRILAWLAVPSYTPPPPSPFAQLLPTP